MNLGAARIFVRDLHEAQGFYANGLGLPLVHGSAQDGFCVFDAGRGVQLVVETVDANAPDEDQVLVDRFTGLSFSVPSVAERYQQLLSMGVHFAGPPERQAWGGKLATFSDPAGNQLQLVQGPN